MFTEIMDSLFQHDSFMPHGYCFLWFPDILYLHVITDLSTALAYFFIPVMFFTLLRRHKTKLPFPWAFRLFACFIFLCGLTHVVEVVTLWYPVYYFQGILKAVTAAASLATAFLLLPLTTQLMSFLKTHELPESSVNESAEHHES